MNKATALLLYCILCAIQLYSQSTSSAVEIATTYAQNGQFYLYTVPFDNRKPSLRGKTSVYHIHSKTPIYEFDKGFDNADERNQLSISDDGETILYVLAWGENEKVDDLKSVTIYKKGKLAKSYTASEITGCNEKDRQCSFIYSNYDKVIDREKSNFGTINYKRVFKDSISDTEKFLFDYAVFSNKDTVYLTDANKIVHIFDLNSAKLVASVPFDNIYHDLNAKKRINNTISKRFDAPSPKGIEFPNLISGEQTAKALAKYIGMKTLYFTGKDAEKYQSYSIDIEALISRDGKLTIEKLEVDDGLPKQKIIEFFTTQRFDMSFLPNEFDKWYFDYFFWRFRKKSNKKARLEKKQAIERQYKEREVRMTLDSISGVYIPRDLQECFIQLDTLLKGDTKKEMKALQNKGLTGQYHHDIGMWLRNNWGLWGGSRLQKYFTDKGVRHPDDMSSVILEYYHDWLNDKKETWKDWEKSTPNIEKTLKH